jgi:hypothetical protein
MMNTEEDDLLARLHPSLRDSFVRLPTDANIPLTPEQLKAVFPHPEAWRTMIEITMKEHGITEIIMKEPSTDISTDTLV